MPASDWTMELARQTGLRMTAVFSLPASLQGATQREQIQKIHGLMLDVEELIAASCHTVDGRYPGQLDQQAYHLVQELPRCPQLTVMCQRHMPGLADTVALGIAMRLWAGMVDAAKSVRETTRDFDPSGRIIDRPLTPAERKELTETVVHATALGDPIYAAAVPVGPFTKRRKNPPEPVIYTGIPDSLQHLYFLDDIGENPTSPGAVTP